MYNILKYLRLLIKVVYPAHCVFCGKIIPLGTASVDICQICANIGKFHEAGALLSKICRIRGLHGLGPVFSLFRYEGVVRKSLHHYKFANRSSFYRTYASMMSQLLSEAFNRRYPFDIIIPVPLHKNRELSRGYNQAYLIAKELGHLLHMKVNKNILVRHIDTKSQSRLNRYERANNIENAFAVINPYVVKERHILLVDDIITTGSTLEECARVLNEAGTADICAIGVASGRAGVSL